jgi:hypothetical protein
VTSICRETGQEHDVFTSMDNLVAEMKKTEKLPEKILKESYENCLYGKGEFTDFILPAISEMPISLKITGVSETGCLQLIDKNHSNYSCAFNELLYCFH